MAANKRQRSGGGDPIAGAQLADQIRGVGWRRSLPAADQLITAGPDRPAAGVQGAQRQALAPNRKVERMRSEAERGRPRRRRGVLLAGVVLGAGLALGLRWWLA